jgi:hypothetical protein
MCVLIWNKLISIETVFGKGLMDAEENDYTHSVIPVVIKQASQTLCYTPGESAKFERERPISMVRGRLNTGSWE